MKEILRQTIINMRTQPLLSALTILGTAVSICLIMIVVTSREATLIDFGNEPNRSRTLYNPCVIMHHGDGGISSSSTGVLVFHELFRPLKTPEAVAAYNRYANEIIVNAQDKDPVKCFAKIISDGYLKIFKFNFLEGKPFSPEDYRSNRQEVMITKTTCRRLFGTDHGVTGRTIYIRELPFTVKAVVEDVPPMMKSAFADLWIPRSFSPNLPEVGRNIVAYEEYEWMGDACVAILAKDKSDFPKIRKEVETRLKVLNKKMVPDTLDLMDQPDVQEVFVNHIWSNHTPKLSKDHLAFAAILAVFLIVPAINIASMTQSRMRQRKTEIGIRRAFGARRSTILWQVFMESLVQTILAGIIGLIACFLLFRLAGSNIVFLQIKDWDSVDEAMDMRIFFQPFVYLWALLFCLVLNTLCSLLPAWRASRVNIVESLK